MVPKAGMGRHLRVGEALSGVPGPVPMNLRRRASEARWLEGLGGGLGAAGNSLRGRGDCCLLSGP